MEAVPSLATTQLLYRFRVNNITTYLLTHRVKGRVGSWDNLLEKMQYNSNLENLVTYTLQNFVESLNSPKPTYKRLNNQLSNIWTRPSILRIINCCHLFSKLFQVKIANKPWVCLTSISSNSCNFFNWTNSSLFQALIWINI